MYCDKILGKDGMILFTNMSQIQSGIQFVACRPPTEMIKIFQVKGLCSTSPNKYIFMEQHMRAVNIEIYLAFR
jgi:hypothetical protein